MPIQQRVATVYKTPAVVSSAPVVTPWYLTGGISPTVCIAAYQAKGAASYAASKINLANPGTYDLHGGVDFTWDATNGWTGANDKYLLTGINMSGTNQQYSCIARVSDLGVGVTSGIYGGYSGFSLLIYGGTWSRAYSGGSYDSASYTDGAFAVRANKFYRNGTELGTITSGAAISETDIAVGASRADGYIKLSGKIQAIAFYNAALSVPQVEALTTAINAL
jgi:hypothetical protein